MSETLSAWGTTATFARPAVGKDGGGSELGPKNTYSDCVYGTDEV